MKITPPQHESTHRDEVVARNQAARKSRPLLDPHGIYGTRTASRVRAAQRRRQVQSLATLAALVAIIVAAIMWTTQKRVPALKLVSRTAISARPAAQPAWASVGTEAWLIVPTQNGSLVPVEAADSTTSTPFRAAFAFRAQPAIAGSTAFAPAEDGTLYAVDWRSGRLLWTFQGAAAMSARPALARVALSGSSTLQTIIVCGDDSGNVVALQARSGKVIWKQALHAPVGNGLTATLSENATATRGEVSKVIVPLLAGTGTMGGAACLDAQSGKILWRADLAAAFLPPPALDGQFVYCVGDNGSVFCLDVRNGHKIWKVFAAPEDASPGAVVLRGEPLVQSYVWGTRVFCGGNDGVLRCFDAQTGRAMWAYAAGAPIRCRPRALALKESDGTERNIVLCGSEGAFAFALDAQSGELLWKARTSGPAFATPGIAHDLLVCLTQEGGVERFALPQ